MGIFVVFVALLLVQTSTQHSLTPRIVNGESASRNQFPFIVSVQLSYLRLFPYIHVCAGTIIDAYWVLTTATCIQRLWGIGIASVKVNMYFTYAQDDIVKVHKIAHKIPHENFNSSRDFLPYDIGLLKLEIAISDPPVVQLYQQRNLPTGRVLIAGWGKTEENEITDVSAVLQYALVNILTNQECERRLSETLTVAALLSSQMCTYTPRKGVAGCAGDAGGPVFRYVDGVPEIVGLISWTLKPCGAVGVPTVHTRLSDFTTWVHNKMSPQNAANLNSFSSSALVQPC